MSRHCPDTWHTVHLRTAVKLVYIVAPQKEERITQPRVLALFAQKSADINRVLKGVVLHELHRFFQGLPLHLARLPSVPPCCAAKRHHP